MEYSLPGIRNLLKLLLDWNEIIGLPEHWFRLSVFNLALNRPLVYYCMYSFVGKYNLMKLDTCRAWRT